MLPPKLMIDPTCKYFYYFFFFKRQVLSKNVNSFRLPLFDFNFVKMVFEFDDDYKNCETVSYNTSCTKRFGEFVAAISPIEDELNIQFENVELNFPKRSCFILFKNEKNQLIDINSFLVHINN